MRYFSLLLSFSTALQFVSGLAQANQQIIIAQSKQPVKTIDQGVQLYLSGQYKEAKEVLEQAVDVKGLDPSKRRGGLMYLAFCKVALGDAKAAQTIFEQLQEEDLGFQLPPGTPPKIAAVFAQARSTVILRIESSPTQIQHTPPTSGTLGLSIEISAAIAPPPPQGEVVVRFRYDEQSSFGSCTMNKIQKETFLAQIPSPMGAAAGFIQYFIEVHSAGGAVRATAGDAAHPFQIPFRPPLNADPSKTNISSSKWWIWPIVGGVLVGAGIAVALSLSGAGEKGGRAVVNIQVESTR
jgi:hypothetical protein